MIQLNSVPKGTRFLCGYGDVWVRLDKHGAHSDVFHAKRARDGFESCFGGSIAFKEAPRG